MKIDLLFEAEMNRRNFLKFLGKAGAAAAGAPLDKLGLGMGQLGQLAGLSGGESLVSISQGGIYDSRKNLSADNLLKGVSASYNFLKQMGVGEIRGDGLYMKSMISRDVVQKIIDNSSKSETTKSSDGVYIGDVGDLKIAIFTPESGWLDKYVDTAWDAKKKIDSSLAATKSAVEEYLNYFAGRGRDVKYSDKLREWLSEKGIKINPTKVITFEGYSDVDKKNVRNYFKKLTKEEQEEFREMNPLVVPPEYRRDAHYDREVGYEKENQFDPRTSRPAQALSPFESRLEKKLALFEAGMNRRNFLKFLGKAGAVAAGNPLGDLDSLINFFQKSNIHGDDIGTQFHKLLYDDAHPNNPRAGRSKLNPNISIDMAKGWFANKIKKLISGGKKKDMAYWAFENLLHASSLDRKGGPLNGWTHELMRQTVDAYGPIDTIKSIVFPANFISMHAGDHLDGEWFSGVWEVHTERINRLSKHSSSLKQFLVKNGAADLTKLNNDELFSFFEKVGVLKPEQTKALREKEIERKTKQEAEASVQEIEPSAHLDREVGYEKENQFDPRTSRPAQALGPFESRLKTSLMLFEADMNRRDFLKFVGKAGAAAAGAPLDMLDMGTLGKLEKLASAASTKKYMIMAPTYSHYGRGMPPSLTDSIGKVESAFLKLINLTGSKMIKPLGDYDYEYGTLIDEKKFKEIAAKYDDMGYDKEGSMFWFKDGITVYETDVQGVASFAGGYGDDLMDAWNSDNTPIITDPVKQWVREYSGYDMPNLIQTPEDIAEFKKRGLIDDVPEEMHGKIDNAIENTQDKVEHEAQQSVKELRPGGYAGRVSGYEKENQFDPRTSRPVQAIGPFESRLLGLLEKNTIEG